MKGAPPKYDYSELAFKVIDKPEPLHDLLNAFRSLSLRQMMVIQLNGTDKDTQEALRNNFYVAAKGTRVRTEVENGIMRVWIDGHVNGNGRYAKNGTLKREVIHMVEAKRRVVKTR